MFIYSRRHSIRRIAGGLAMLMLCSPASGLLTTAQAQAGGYASDASAPIVSILVFPFSNNAGTPAQSIGPRLDDAIKLRLNSVGAYKVTAYSRFLAPVQRAAQETPPVLTQDDLTSPEADPQKAGKVASQVATDGYLIGAVESFTADPNTRKVSIEVSANLRSTASGSSLRTLAFTGSAAPTSNADTLDTVTQQAVNIVASRIAASINSGRPAHSVMPASQRGHSDKGEKLLLVVLLGSLAYAILHNSGGGSSSGTGILTTPTGGGTTGTGGTGGGTSPGGPPAPP